MNKKKIGIIAGVTIFCIMVIVVVIILNRYDYFEKLGRENQSEIQQTEKLSDKSAKKNSETKGSVSIWIMGDSLAAENRKNRDAEGWGAMLQQYLKSNVTVRNAATGGASTSSYLAGGNYNMVMDGLQKGDYVIIQFGHNDVWYEDRYTDPYADSDVEGSFKYLLKNNYIMPILERGAYPILATSVMTCAFDENGELYEMLYSAHAQAMREVVEECEKEDIEVTLIDTYAITEQLYRELGEEQAWRFHNDQVHYNNYGAAYVAGIIAEELNKAEIECCQDIYTIEEIAVNFE